MISFLFAVLGSVTFWICYFMISIFMGLCMIKHFAPHCFKYIETKGKENKYGGMRNCAHTVDSFEVAVVVCFQICFWPISLMCLITVWLMKYIVTPISVNILSNIAKLIPDISIKVDKKENDE